MNELQERVLDLLDNHDQFIVDKKAGLIYENQRISVVVYDANLNIIHIFARKSDFEDDVERYQKRREYDAMEEYEKNIPLFETTERGV